MGVLPDVTSVTEDSEPLSAPTACADAQRLPLFRGRRRKCSPLKCSPYFAGTTGLPSRSLVFCTDQEPPGAPLRSGSTVIFSWVPGGSVLADQPSRDRPPGAAPSRFHTSLSWPFLTSRRMNVCGLVNLNSFTVPLSSIGCS